MPHYDRRAGTPVLRRGLWRVLFVGCLGAKRGCASGRPTPSWRPKERQPASSHLQTPRNIVAHEAAVRPAYDGGLRGPKRPGISARPQSGCHGQTRLSMPGMQVRGEPARGVYRLGASGLIRERAARLWKCVRTSRIVAWVWGPQRRIPRWGPLHRQDVDATTPHGQEAGPLLAPSQGVRRTPTAGGSKAKNSRRPAADSGSVRSRCILSRGTSHGPRFSSP
jgi:hypothetical protein